MKKALAAFAIIFIFLIPVASSPAPEGMFRYSGNDKAKGNDFLPSDWQSTNSGIGEPLSGTLNGFKVASGTSVIDYSHSAYIDIDPPLGWSSEQLEGQLDHLSMWVDDVLVNPNLDAYHEEHWFMPDDPSDNDDPFYNPDGWTFVKNDPPPSGTPHPQHGYFEINGVSGGGYDSTMGWRFDGNLGSSAILDPTNGFYISQQIPTIWRSIYSAEISFRYYVSSTSTLNDEVYIFTSLEGYVSKHHVFDLGTPMDTWLQDSATVPSSFFESLQETSSLLFDIGLGTDINGNPSTADHEVFIDEIEIRLLVRPFPEQIDLRANGAIVTGSTLGSISPYVPDGSNRDCYSAPDSNGGSGGIDPNGYTDNGWLDVGADIPAYPDWTTAFAYQVGLQFPLQVPQGSAITSATLQVETPSDSTGFPGMRIYVAAEDDVSAFTSETTLLPDKYDWVNTSVYWRPTTWLANGRYDTPDISALIQEVVSRPGWQSGNYICIMMDYAYSNQQYAYNQIKGSSGFAQADLARLFVEFIGAAPSDVIPGFRFNKNIIIDHTKVVSDLQDFPVLVDIWDEDLHLNVQPDGDDIAFLYNGQVIPHDLELFDKKGNGTHAHLVCWVNVPHLSSVGDTTIVMVYGDEDLGSQEDPLNVWNSDFSAVWHMDDNPAQPQWDSTYADYLPHQPQIQDSTLSNLDGLTYGTMTSSDSVSGQIGSAIDLEGVNDFVDFGNPSDLQMTGAFTVEAWFKADFIDNDYLVVKSGESNYRGWDLSFDDDPRISPGGWVMFRFSPDGVAMTAVGYERVETDQWYHVVGVFSPSSYVRFYLNGELTGELTTGVPASVYDPPNRPVRIGRRSDNPGGTSYMDAIVDEVRISGVARSDAWIRTQYNNQKNPHLFMTIGDQGVNFRYMKDITIDHTKVESDLADFPVLIDIFDSDLRTDVQTDGDDIAFALNGKSIPHEIELFDQAYNSTHAHLVCWVKTDLSSTTDTTISMYYGNSEATNQETPSAVWTNRYQGVWHLSETSGGSGAFKDSTSNLNHGTDSGAPTLGIEGAVGNAISFDGIDDEIDCGNGPSLTISGSAMTIEAWVYLNEDTAPQWGTGIAYKSMSYSLIQDWDASRRFTFEANADLRTWTSDTNKDLYRWYHVVGVYDGTNTYIYVDGLEINFAANTGNIDVTASPVYIGWGDQYFDGRIDEVRILDIDRSAEWILTEFRNQNDPSSFYSLGIEREVVTPEEVPLDFMYKKDITIDHTKVTSDLYGFPVLIDLYDADLRFNVQPDGDDILFAKDGWVLPHEIEFFEQSYNSSHAHLITWVRTDLSASSDTVLSMYYGNPTTESRESPQSVWDTSFAAVWHLSEDPAGTVYDSTANNNDGIGRPIGSEPTLQAGKIDGCSEFYGEATNNRIEAPHSTSLVLPSDMLVEAWIRTSNTDSTSDAIVAKWGDVGHRNYWLGKLDDSTLAFYVDNTQSVSTSLSWVNDGYWHHVAGVANAGTGELLLYIDGVERGSGSYSGSTQTGTSVIQIANNPGSVGFIQEWDGRIDEVRVSSTYRSLDWIVTEFNNQNDPDSFYILEDETKLVVTYEYSRQFTITSGSEPVPAGYATSVTINHAALVSAGKSQIDGDDLRILYWNGLNMIELDRILDFDSSWNSATTKIWFRIQTDIPASSADDQYFIYYGNPTVSNPPNNYANIFQFYDGFESGDVSAWDGSYTDTGDTLIVLNTPLIPVHSGTYAVRGDVDDVAAAQAMVWKDFSDKSNLFARVHFYLPVGFSTSDHVTIMQYVDTSGGWQNQLSVTIRDDMTLYMWNAVFGEAYGYGTTSTISTGSWHTLDMQAKISDTDGEARLWLDGSLEIEASGVNLGTEGIDRFCTVFYWASPQTEPNTVIADDAFLRPFVSPEPTSIIGPEIPQDLAFNYKKEISIDHTKVDADLEDFPLLIDIFDSDLRTKTQADGDDIIFKKGETILPHEIELFDQTYNGTHAHLVCWVKSDLSSTADTTITMYYGNSATTNLEYPFAVWTNKYLGVWHLSENPTGTLYDSSGNLNHGTGYNLQSDDQVDGQIDGSIDFDNVQDYIDCGNDTSLNVGSNDFSLSLWFNYDGVDNGVLAGKGAVLMARRYLISIDTVGGYLWAGIDDDNTVAEYVYSTSTYADSLWHHVSLVRDGNNLRLYIDGVEDPNSPTDITGYGSLDEVESFYIGAFRSEIYGTLGYWSTANTDEVRVTKMALSPEWIAVEYNNQLDPNSFYSIGAEISSQTIELNYKKDIVVDHTQVSADLTNFPLLVDIFDRDLRTKVQSDGDDIIFKVGETILPHELELFDQTYNSTHAHLVAWVKTDLSSSVDTTLSMYYGNPSLENQERPSDVWNSNYVAVWHMNQDPSSSMIIDSTINGYDLTATGFGSDQRIYDGKLGTAISVDGLDDRFGISGISGPVNDFTFQSWFTLDNPFPPGSDMHFFRGNSLTNDYPLMRFAASSGLVVTHMEVTSDNDETCTGTKSSWEADTWFQFAWVRNMSAVRAYHYLNGSLDATDTSSDNANPHLAWDQLAILSDFVGGNMWGSGVISEFRILNVALSTEWIAAEYLNQNDPSGFYSMGAEISAQPIEFNHKKDIVVDHTKVASDLTDFPLLINIFDMDLRTDVQADGDDIIFKSGETMLPHELELFDQTYNGTHAHLVCWVKSNLSSTDDTTITMYYGNPEATNQEDPIGVWNGDYRGVWHLSEASGNAQDSTNYQTHGTPSGLVTQGVSGHIGNAYYFDRDNVGTVNMGDPADGHLDFGNTDDFTIEFWVNLDYFYYYEPFIVSKRNGLASSSPGYAAFVSDDNNGYAGYSISSDGPQFGVDATTPLLDTGWRHVVYVFDQDSDTISTIYVDGVDDKSSTWGTIGSVGSLQNSANFRLNGESSPSTEDMFDGMLDEVRISSVARSAGWIFTEFNNQNDPSSFYSIEGEIDLQPEYQPGVQITDFSYRKNLIVDHTKVGTDLVNFPLLVDIFDADLRTDVQPDGDDIMFKSGYIWCPHEITFFDQTYNSTHAHLVAWVKTDLSSSIDTTITMYYGNPDLTSQENPSAVWGNYAGVWHLEDSPIGTVYDSSPSNNDGVTLGSMSGSDLVPGQIGSGFELDGIDDMINVSESSSLDSIKYAGTLSLWIDWENVADGGYQRVMTTSDRFILNPSPPPTLLQDDGFEWAVQPDGDHFFYPWGGNSINYNFVTNPFTNNVWHHLVVTLDYSTKSVIIYLDGSALALDVENVPTEWTQLASLGDWLWGGNQLDAASHFLGKFDEIRVTSAVQSSGWVLTEYNNQYDPSSFFSVGLEEQISGEGYIFTTSSESAVTIGAKLSMGVQTSFYSYTDDFITGTSFSIVNGSLPVWTAGVLVSPPDEVTEVSFEISYPEGDWWPFSVTSPSGIEKTYGSDWMCYAGKLMVGSTAIEEYGMWQIQFLDRNHVLDTQVGPSGGPYSSTDKFTLGEDVQFRVWSSGIIGSTISLDLIDPSGSTWYTGTTTFQGERFSLPYYHRKHLTINHENIAEDLAYFPVLVDIYDTDLRTDARADGRDIAFTIGEETLSHEIELFDQTFNSTHAHLVAWLNVPLLSGSSDTVITMYYGNPLAPIVYDSGPVWDSGYLGVWHLGESGTGALDEYLDSSQYKNHGQGGEGNSSFVPTQTVGKIGSGQDFNNLDGYYDLIDCGDSPLWNIDGYQITLEAWIQHDITPNTHVYGIMNHKGWYDGYSLYINYGGGSTLKPTFSLPGQTHQLVGANDVTGGAWHHVVATYDGSLMRIYVDGIQDPTVLAKSDAIMPSSYEQGFWIGHGDQPKDRVWSAEWDGQIDEVRISDVVRSAGWIQTQFENQENPGSFYSVGAEQTIGYSESASINLDASAPAGVWHATARYSDSGSDVSHRAGVYTRSFIVQRGTSLSLLAPGDAVADGITTKLVGEQLYVEFELEDTLDATLVSGATVSMNWSVSGVPTDVQLNDYGGGRYGKTLNTSDLDTYGRWRIDLETSHPYYTDATDFFYLDLSHGTFLTYQPPVDTIYGDNFEVRLTLRDQFDNAALTGATISCNATIIGLPTDYGNGTYLVTIDSTGFSTGEHTFRFSATPDTSYLLSSNIDVQFTYRPIATEVTPLSLDDVEAPWGHQANTSVYWSDVDHAGIGVDGGSISISPFVQTQLNDEGGGYYSLTIDVSSLTPGTYFFNLTFSKQNYQSSMSTISITILAHRTTPSIDYNSTIPVGTEAYFDVSWLDLDLYPVLIGSGNLSQVNLDWGTGSDSFPTFSFWLDTSGWAVGSYTINVTISATGAPRFYMDSYIEIQLEIRKLNVYLSWDPLEPFPNGNDFVMFVYVNVSEPGNPIDGTPIAGLDQSYFSATNETGGPYTFESFSNLGEGVYQITIDSTRFLEGQYKIIVFVDFLSSENYRDSSTTEVSFSYRPILTYLSSPDYPTVTTSFDTNVTIMLSYVDIDHVQNVTIGLITSEGASIVWQHIGDGVYEVLIIVQGWDLGAHEVNLTADASGYQAKTLTFQILVQIAYAYARSSVSIIDLPVGDTAVFFVDYWDITHDEPIPGATIIHNWTYSLSTSWTGDQYRIELPSIDTDELGTYLVMFNFSKGPNFQFGYLNLTIILRTHLTEFRLASAIEPTSYNAMINISVYCGDLDNDAGIIDAPVSLSVFGESGLILSTFENDTVLGDGYYIIQFAATNLGSSGIYDLTVYFNWTGPVQKYYNGSVAAFVRIIGETSDLELIDSAEPTPYLGNLTYTYLYSELYSGNGISNISAPAGNVFIYVEFIGYSFSPSLFSISEDTGNPGYYSIEFNSTIFDEPGAYTMIVYVNWSKTQEPFYGNWTDTLSVRIIPRSTLINLIPPESTPYGVNATFSFSFDDVADSSTYSVADSSQMSITIGLPDYTITYNESTRVFHVSFNTSILGEPLGTRQFSIGVNWTGSPFYANVTGRNVIINVRFRETEFDYSAISPTPYGNNVTLSITFIDVTLGSSQTIDDGFATLYNGSQEIPVSEYSFTPLGNGEYEIELKTTYFTKPGTYSITVEMSTGHFYYAVVSASRTLSLQYRLTVLLIEPVEDTPYNNSIEVVFHYSDVVTLADIGNSSTPTTIQILNGSSWLFSSVWRGGSEDYLLTVQTYNQVLEINKEYVLWIELSYPDASPFYLSADAFVSFTLRERSTNLELTSSPEPTQYLENINFTVSYQDTLSLSGIASATITLTVGGLDLVEGVDYLLQTPTAGSYLISLNTTAIGSAGTTVNLQVTASWTAGAPYYSTSAFSLTLSVTQRNSITGILSSTTLVKYLENVTFTIRYSDASSGQEILFSKNQLLIYSEGTLLQSNDFLMMYLGPGYGISINSSVLNVGLLSNWNITFYIEWQDNVAPYYSDGRASTWVNVVNRVGIVIRDATPTVPIHDNMTLKFTYVDGSTGAGVNDAIVLFDCLSPSGLVEGIDFWILRDHGNYSILVYTTSLGSTGTFTFSLRLLWNPTLEPFYRNTTTLYLQGTVRLIQAQLTNEEPDPSTVPINDNVSVVLNLQDLDHASPINGAEGSFSVRYKTNASGPATWSITPISPGVYELVVDCSDAGATGTNALIITLSFMDYQTVEVQVPFQIRLREGELNEIESPSTFYGEETYVIVELIDTDGSNAPIDGAILTITWPDVGYTPDYGPIGPGLYNITLTTASLDAGLYTLVVGAQKSDFFISDISVAVQILSIPTELILPQSIPDVYWGEDVSVWAIFNDTRDSVLLSGAKLVYQFGVLSGSLTEVIANPGNYTFTVDTENLALATTYIISITATLENYVTITNQLPVNILKLPIDLTIISETQQELFKGSPVNITVYVNNTYSNTPLLGATVEVTYFAQGEQNILLSQVPGRDGYYSGLVDTDALYVGDYVFTITADRTNYITATTSVNVKVKQISTVVWLDALTSTYSTETFNWSDTIRIGIYVLAEPLNLSDPLSTGLANCTVQWSLSGTAFTGEFLNGTSIGGPGYFYFDFDTYDYSASTYTLRIIANPNVGMFAYSSNLTTLIIEPIETSVVSTYLSSKIWGWTGWVNLTYWDLLFDIGIPGANVFVDWAGTESISDSIANGTYRIYINTSLVSPGIYPVSVRFQMDNYKIGTGVFTLIVKEVPTSITAFAPAINQVDNDVLNLEVPYGDSLPLTLFYNDTWYNRGIPGATEMTGVILGQAIPEVDYLLIEEIADGNYSLLLDTTRWEVSAIPYRLILSIYLANWSRATINIQVTIIDVPTGLQVQGEETVGMSYGEIYSIWVFYYDDWAGHAREGIAGGSINATSLDTQYVVVSFNQSDPSRPGWYEIRIRSQRVQGSTIVSIILSRDNFETASVNIAVSVEPSDLDLLIERAIIFGVPIGLVIIAGAVLWTRLFSVPKRLREIRGMVRTISRGKIPQIPDNVPSRQEMVAALFNDIAGPVGITRAASSMPSEAIASDVPEIEELLIQLSILSKLTTEELEDFKLDVSKMKLSEQVNFVKEVINQEAIKQGRIERKPMELILEETAAQARALLAGEEIEVPERKPAVEPVKIVEMEKPEELPPKPIDYEDVDSTDVLSEHELKDIRKRLVDAGIKGSELETIMSQTRELPRELAEELLKSILGEGGGDE